MQVSDRLTRWINREFPKGTAEPVLQILRDMPYEVIGGQDPERIHAALVLRTHGEWTSFKSNVALAHLDWRDALVCADLADEDWPQRLANLED